MTEITNEMFKGYFVPTPIPNKYFSMELCELVDIDVDGDSVLGYWHTGEIINLVFNEETKKYHLDKNLDRWFWYDENDVILELEKKVGLHFNNDKFKKILSYLYEELLEGKTYVGTMNSYMFMQRFAWIGLYTFE